jgi:hypothetical protein
MIVVADTGPIIALAKPGRIDLLGVFGADIWVPPRVRRELLSKPDPDLGPRKMSIFIPASVVAWSSEESRKMRVGRRCSEDGNQEMRRRTHRG